MFKAFFKEFRDFAVKGNVIDMAVGIIIGAAFNNIVNSLVRDIIMPPIGIILGNIDFTNMFVVLQDGKVLPPYHTLAAAQSAGAITLNIGAFINYLISFIIVAFSVFVMIKAINKFKDKPQPAPLNTKECPYCARTIPLKAVKCPECTADLKKSKR